MSSIGEKIAEIVTKVINPPPLSLKEYCVIKVITGICNHSEVTKLFKECVYAIDYDCRMKLIKTDEWNSVQEKVTEMVSKLGIPKVLEEEIVDRLWPLASRKLLWMEKYAEFVEMEVLQDFSWTDRGKIEGTSTANSIIKNTCVCIRKRFQLSLLFCRFDESRELWRAMSSEQKVLCIEEKCSPMDYFLFSIIEQTSDEMKYYHATVECVLESGYLQLVKFLLQILPEENKKGVPVQFLEILSDQLDSETFLEEENIEVCFFLLNQMDDDTKALCFEKYPCLMLCCFLEYPDLSFFMSYFRQALINEMPRDEVCGLLQFIFFKFHVGEVNYDKFRLLFVEVWRIIPSDFRNHLRRSDLGSSCGFRIIMDHFPFLLEKSGYFEMERFISRNINPKTASSLLRFDLIKWRLLKFLIDEKLITVQNMKEEIKIRFSGTDRSTVVAWKEVKRFIDLVSKYKD